MRTLPASRLDVTSDALPSTFMRTKVKRKKFADRSDFDEFDTLGIFNTKQEDSPTALKMRMTAVLTN